MESCYQDNGYFVVRNLFSEHELAMLYGVLRKHHNAWKKDNAAFYAEKAVNSAYITGTQYLNLQDRHEIFRFVAASKLMNIVATLIPIEPLFMGTQLFFDPAKPDQKNYWHRDTQYHLSIAEQAAALNGPTVLHFRVPMVDEPGLELVPGTHKRWDSAEELRIRLEDDGENSSESLSSGVEVSLNAGDLLVFSGNMIHRGLYGMDRFAFDILYSDPDPALVEFIREDCLPTQETVDRVDDASAFLNTIRLKKAPNSKTKPRKTSGS